ncbi:hypothetical protein LTR10_011648 [Elasticomyces elasticus]|uniref:Uncharacterized protein n=1 Tax=Exophiala sideris TaxID=1016849 RepID=A0ABR0JD28_9EURO|nr:hypothetical protein LTR10_011648 [Elasticomyces elasticus]KAK5031894.1 hypothetical protein LTS07_004515 [Exophiala sideris]KAK5040823.1 hypothetical protein LTR13_003124 [Exophiala sideris]KAK5061842.1 hypothetical protein LTR69_005026 [Exophiala sideris]KAK5184542.1 hypothetical protein LTR44_003217 [Eurotiomycetes sp. CCFEE 6388]
MVSHTRSRSKSSFSIFSFDTIRSLSRAGSRQARIPSKDDLNDRAESSLSYRCDPHNQPPSASPEPVHTTHASGGPPGRRFLEGKDNHIEKEALPGRVEESVQASTASERRARRFRPLSWLPFTQPSSRTDFSRSLSVQLPKAASTSTVARSVISAPILTSTTNVGVANAEGVRCQEITGLAFSQSTCNPQVGWHASSEQQNDVGPPQDGSNNKEAQNKQTVVKAKSTTDTPGSARDRMLRFRNVLRSKVRSIPHRHAERNARPPAFDPIMENADASVDLVAAEGALERRRVENINLYKDKIKELTGIGHGRRKSLNSSKELAALQEDPPLLGEFTTTRVNDSEQSDNEESVFGSLTKSFASAVDKLDFHTPAPRNMSFLRSKSSFFLSKKGDSGDADRSEMKRQETTSRPAQPSSPPTMPTRLPPAPLPPGPRPPPTPDKTAQIDLAARKCAPSPVVFSTEQNAYVPSKPVPGYPRGVNPLRMHPPDTFASPPSLPHQPLAARPRSDNIDSVVPQAERPSSSKNDQEEDDTVSLEDAPIYSPSLGDLSQYSRDTPPSTGQRRTNAPRPKAVYVTPTRDGLIDNKTPGDQRGGLLKKSRSALFGRSRVPKPLETSSNIAPSPLYERDVNQKISIGNGKRIKKSRSLQFAGLFKKESHSSLPAPLSRDPTVPFQPATPSPLRNVTRASRGNDTTRAKAEGSPSLLQSRK